MTQTKLFPFSSSPFAISIPCEKQCTNKYADSMFLVREVGEEVKEGLEGRTTMKMAMSMVRSGLQSALRISGRTAAPSNMNFSSSANHNDAYETTKWEKITYLVIASCTILVFYNLSKGHPHFEEPLAYPYLHIKNNEFPWSGENFAYENKQLVPLRRSTSSSPCILPGIGLHFNALAATTKDPRVVKHETLASGKELISMRRFMTSFSSLSSEQNPSSKPLLLNSLKLDMGPASSEVQVMQNVSQASAFNANEDFSESPKKKRRRVGHAGESESSCKHCNYKKSKCLKL